jgi:hypothetical protein
MLRSDEPGQPAYSWVDLPADAPSIKLGDNGFKDEVPLGIEFPFYGYIMTDTLVTSDGTLAFSLPSQQYSGPIGRCFPMNEFHFFVIAPFRADLDPSKGGAVRYGTIDGGTTFVLSYEQVPLHTGPANATYTFQVLLHEDGRIVFQYHDLAALPAKLGVGVQRSAEETQTIGCGSATPIGNQLSHSEMQQHGCIRRSTKVWPCQAPRQRSPPRCNGCGRFRVEFSTVESRSAATTRSARWLC